MQQKHNPFKLSFLCPKYWGIWTGYFFLKLLSLTPYKMKFTLGKLLGSFMYYLVPSRKRLALKNIQMCFPELSASEHHSILKEHFQDLGINLMETGINLWGAHRQNTQKNESAHFKFKGLENLENAKAKNQGILLVVPHFTTLEITGLMLSFLTAYRPIYRPHDNALMEYLITTSRTIENIPGQPNRSVIPVSNKDTRTMMQDLRAGKVLMILPDQRYRAKGRVVVPFFGIDAPSNPGINKLAKLGKAKVLPVFTRRSGHSYELTILPALENFPSGDDYADTLRLHQLYEAEIRENPSQYLWTHNRWGLSKNDYQ